MSQTLLTQYTQVWRCKTLLGAKLVPCNTPMLHLHRGGIEYDYCPACYPKIDPERRYSKPTFITSDVKQ